MKKIVSLLLICVTLLTVLMFTGCGKVYTVEDIKKEGKLVVYTEAGFAPYEFIYDNKLIGVDVDVMTKVAEKLGVELDIHGVNFDTIVGAVQSGKAMVGAAGITITEDRKRSVDFSEPYLTTGIVIIYRKDKPVLSGAACKGKRVGVQGGTTSDEYVVNELHEEPERFRSDAEAVVALKGGRCDVVICDLVLARNCIRGMPELALSDPITTEEYAIAVRKGRSDLLAAVNATLRELKSDGRLDRWLGEYIAEADRLRE